jgi:predicted transcriptional regulator
MAERLFTDQELLKLNDQGLNIVQIAKELGVGKAAVSRRLKRLREKVVPEVVKEFALVGASGADVIDRGLNAMDQLLKINNIVNNELDFLQTSIANCQPLQRPVLQKQQLSHVAEVRQQISLLTQIAQTLSQFEEVRKFQEIVISEIGKCDEETRNRILTRLEQACPTGAALDLG